MIFPADFVSQYVPRGSASPGDLELDVIFEDHGVSWLTVDEMFALSLADLSALVFCAIDSLSIAEVQQTEVRSPLA